MSTKNPDVGTWKFNAAQSKISPNYPLQLKQGTLVVSEIGDEIELAVSGTLVNGSPISLKHSFPQGGGAIKPAPAGSDAGILTIVTPHEFYSTSLKGGKQLGFQHIVISADGKTKRSTIKGTGPDGKPSESLAVWDKQ
jgi:hypothetical protein